jgi:mRNA interferase MazF
MNVRRGDILLAHYPLAASAGTKKRPVLVIQNDQDNQRLTNTIVVQITSNLRRAYLSTHLLVEISTSVGKESGLLVDSVISCVNIITIEGSRIERTIGRLPPLMMAKVNSCLKAALDLP